MDMWALTRLRCVLSGGTGGRGLVEAVDGDWLVYDEEPADHVPFAGPEQSYTVQDKQHNMRRQQCPLWGTHQLVLHITCPVQVKAARLRFIQIVFCKESAMSWSHNGRVLPSCLDQRVNKWMKHEYQRVAASLGSGIWWTVNLRKQKFQWNKQNSLLCISVNEGVVGEHEASMGTEQQSVAHIRHWRGFSGSPTKHRSTQVGGWFYWQSYSTSLETVQFGNQTVKLNTNSRLLLMTLDIYAKLSPTLLWQWQQTVI